jgi:hypothetical protein
MSSLGYSDFNGGSGGTPNGASGNGSSDGYIASKRKNKTVKAFDTARLDGGGGNISGSGTGSNGLNSESGGRVNPKLEKLKASIAKIHAESSDDDDESDDTGAAATSVLPTYPGQQQANAASKNQNLKISPPIADAGSGSGPNALGPPPTTSEGRTHQPMFSMSQQFANRYGVDDASGGGAGGGVEQFKMKAPSTYAAQYYKQYAPYNYNRLSNELSSPGANNDEFIEKLNYIIHLLEEQHSERTEHVMEELVLYCFLGVFIIFIVDSFARAGKYTR